MSGSLVADLGIGPETWLFLTLLGCLTLFFKFSRFWSVRNLDLLLLFAPAPGLMRLVGAEQHSWSAFVWLFFGCGLWFARCLIDLGLVRRPSLEPNLNFAGLACLALGILVVLLIETINLPLQEGTNRNPADPHAQPENQEPRTEGAIDRNPAIREIIKQSPLPRELRDRPPRVVVGRILAVIAHLGLVVGLFVVGSRHFERPIAGLTMATCYLILPYTRIALVDSGQLIPAALIVAAVVFHKRMYVAAALLGLAGGWMPASLGLLPLWAAYYRGRGSWKFIGVGVGCAALCGSLALGFPVLSSWARDLGARSLASAGLLPGVEAPTRGSFWTAIDPVYRSPVLIGYLAFVVFTVFVPARKNLAELIALSAALIVASQFWYLDEGGTLVLLYLPLVLMVVFRPNLTIRRLDSRPARSLSTPKSAVIAREP